MHSKMTFSVIGLGQDDYNNFSKLFLDSPLSHSFYLQFLDYQEETLIASLYETDILIINPFVFEKGPLETFLNIRRAYPLIQVAVVSYGSHYGVLLSALRGGIQDIIHYPWDRDEVVSVIDGLINKLYLQQKDAKLSRMLELVTFFGQSKKMQSLDGLFHQVQEFMWQQFATETLFIIKVSQNKMTKIYGKSSSYEEEVFNEVSQFFSGVEKRHYNFDYMEMRFKSKEYFIVNLDDFEESKYLAVMDLESPILKEWKIEVIIHFARIFKDLFQRTVKDQKSDELNLLIYLDDLTGLYNQRRLKHDLELLEKRFKENGDIFSALFIDLDYFKKVNDQYGHLIGSMLLTEVSKEFKKVVRESDLIYRYGGDEFIVLIPDVDADVAKNIALRILEAIKKKRFSKKFHDLIADPFSLSVSIGVAEFPKDAKTVDKIIVMADEMMYQVKKKGRGAVCHAERLFTITKDESN